MSFGVFLKVILILLIFSFLLLLLLWFRLFLKIF